MTARGWYWSNFIFASLHDDDDDDDVGDEGSHHIFEVPHPQSKYHGRVDLALMNLRKWSHFVRAG